MVSISRCQFN